MKSTLALAVLALAVFALAGSLPLAAQQSTSPAPGTQVTQYVFHVPGQKGSAPQSTAVFTSQAMQQMKKAAQQMLDQAANCPVALNATHLADGSVIMTTGQARRSNGNPHPAAIGQWLHIVVMTPTVSTAELVVRGFSDKPRITQSNGNSQPDAERTVVVTFASRPDGRAIGSVWAPGLTAVDSISLKSLTYLDGSVWNSPAAQTCRITPDPMMLISGR